jgi:TetR/AcrR family transcriptional regulator, cholesterol catabolism regulator
MLDPAARAENRLPKILDAAARLFCDKGYDATSVRDIVQAVPMLPGSLYYHFASKEDLLVAVYAEGVRRITGAVKRAVERESDPWKRLEAASVAHLATLLEGDQYSQVVVRVRPSDAKRVRARLIALRDGYEAIFEALIGALPLARGTDRRSLRLMLLGALNWSPIWYRRGQERPAVLARRFVNLLQGPRRRP